MSLSAYVFQKGHVAGDDDAFDHISVQRFLGNIGSIGYLRDRLSRVLSADSVILARVLFSGSHSGDSIERDLLPHLHQELAGLVDDRDESVSAFRQSMVDLVAAASHESATIDFI